MGNLRFKVIAYRKLQEIMNAGALGCELRLTGKLPSERAKSWRFAEGYLKKAGEPSKEIDRAQSTGLTKSGIIGIKVAIMAPDARIYDKIDIDEEIKRQINSVGDVEDEEKVKEKPAKKKAKKKVTKEVKEVIEKVDDKSNKKDKANLMEKGEVKVIKESPKVKEEEDGTAIMINEELEEGVPAEQIDEDIKEKIEEHKEKLEGEKDKKEEDVKDNVESEK